MAKYISGINRSQITLFPDCIDDFISEDSDVRVLDAFVDSLDMAKLGFKNASPLPSKAGAPSYDPRLLLKIYLYSYPKKIRSSRRIAAELHRNIELMWLTNKLSPDFRTISDFRKINSKPLKNVLISFNSICQDLNLFSRDLKSLDGSKFHAVNSKDNNFTQDKLIDRIKRIENNITAFLDELNSNDLEEDSLPPSSPIHDKLKALHDRKNSYSKLLDHLMDSSDSQISLTDPDSKLMKCNGKMLVGYNAQFLTDSKSHIINDFSISNEPFDNGKIFSSTKDFAPHDSVTEVLADGGYKSDQDLLTCLENKIVPVLPDDVYSVSCDFVDADITPDIKMGNSIDDVKTCLHAGVIPDCYSHLNLSLSVEWVHSSIPLDSSISSLSDPERLLKAKQGFFVRSSSNSVFCPQGFSLSLLSSKSDEDTFIGASFCRNCPLKCCSSPRKILSLSKKKIIQGSRYYHTQTPKFKSLSTLVKVVRITYIPDKKKYKLRKCISEHPFGTLKRSHDASYFLTKGLDKVSGELALSVLGYNFSRLLALVDNKLLIQYFKNKPEYI